MGNPRLEAHLYSAPVIERLMKCLSKAHKITPEEFVAEEYNPQMKLEPNQIRLMTQYRDFIFRKFTDLSIAEYKLRMNESEGVPSSTQKVSPEEEKGTG